MAKNYMVQSSYYGQLVDDNTRESYPDEYLGLDLDSARKKACAIIGKKKGRTIYIIRKNDWTGRRFFCDGVWYNGSNFCWSAGRTTRKLNPATGKLVQKRTKTSPSGL